MAPVGAPAAFLLPGYFIGGTRSIPTVSAGQAAYAQVRVWDQSRGLTFEEALANGGRSGASGIFTVVTGGNGVPPSVPASLTGLSGFSLTNAVAGEMMGAPLYQPILLAPGDRLADGSVEWVVAAPSGTRCVIERSENLVEWSGFVLVRATNGVARFNSRPTGSQTYYRARMAD